LISPSGNWIKSGAWVTPNWLNSSSGISAAQSVTIFMACLLVSFLSDLAQDFIDDGDNCTHACDTQITVSRHISQNNQMNFNTTRL
jgi:hypothetical protein